jgi:ligand-binding sensor domain-containing protein
MKKWTDKGAWIAVLALFIQVCSLNAQVVNFVSYGVEHGLVQSQVHSLVQDDNGKLWVGTISGLSVWDGGKFTNYNRTDSLAEDWVTASFKDSRGNLWFGHWGGSITKWDRQRNASKESNRADFYSIEIEKFNSYQEVKAFVEDSTRGVMFFGTEGSGLFYFDLNTEQVRRLQFSKEDNSRFIKTLYLDDYNKLWIGTEYDGVYVFEEGQDIVDSIPSVHITMEDGLASNNVSQIAEFDNKIWIGSTSGITYFEDKEFAELKNKANLGMKFMNRENGFASNGINVLMPDNKGSLWVGTSDNGVVKISQGSRPGRYVKTHYGVDQGLSFYNVKTMYFDRENTLWIGTDVGLNQYISEQFILYDESVGLRNNIVWAVAPDQDGSIWLGTNEGVTHLLNADNVDNDSISTKHYKVEGLFDVPVLSVYPDDDGNVWFGTATSSLFKRTQVGTYERVNIEAHLQDMIYSIGEDTLGNLWLGTRAGIVRIDKEQHKLSLFTEKKDSIGGNNVFKVLRDKNGVMWFAVLGGSLTSWDGENFKVWGKEDGMNHTFVLSAAEDNDGNLWFGCYSGGLYKYDGEKFTNYNTDSGLVSSTPYAIVADKDNNIWIGTTNGVEKFDQQTNTFTHYSKTEGFLGVEINPNSIARDANENIWFGTILGAVKYNPYLDVLNKVQPTIQLEGLKINQKRASWPVDNKFDPNQNNITLEFLGVSLNNPRKLRYSYQLDGPRSDKEWSEPSATPYASMAGLNAGKYNFNVKAINADGVESDVQTYAFEIAIPFYMSITFYVMQFAIILIMLSLAVFYGRKTGGSRTATILASIAVIIVFEYGINYVEDNLETVVGSIAFIKVLLNVILGLLLFPVERFVQAVVVKKRDDGTASPAAS